MNWSEVWATLKPVAEQLAVWAANALIKIIIALIILVIAFKVINKIGRKIEKSGEKPNHDKTLAKVFSHIFKIGFKSLVLVCLIGYLGIDTSGFTALFVSAGACIGLALNGALGNFAGGILIIFTRPFRVDDFIEAQGISGTVEEIRITSTKLRTPDNKVIYVPNGALSGGNIVNYSEKELRRVDVKFSVDYEADTEKAVSIIKGLINENDLIIRDPAPFCGVTAYEDSAIAITARVWAKNSDYWTVYGAILHGGVAELNKNGITIPYNILDVRVKNG